MAAGSMAQAWGYCNKVFDISTQFRRMTDGRRSATVPLVGILETWLWGMVKRLPSTEQIGDLLADQRWRTLIGLRAEHGGSPDTLARALDQMSVDEVNQLQFDLFIRARRAGVLHEGPYGYRLAAIDMNELFKSRKRHCPHCKVRTVTVRKADGTAETVQEYYHQAVALVWVGNIAWPIGWELVGPGEGESPAALRLIERLGPLLRRSLDGIVGDALYCSRPFFQTVTKLGLDGWAISSGVTEMDQEIQELVATSKGKLLTGQNVRAWAMESQAWQADLHRPLRVMHFTNQKRSRPGKNERRQLRLVTTASPTAAPTGQGWKIGRSRWDIENDTFNILTKDYHLEHNYHHSTTAIVVLLTLRAVAYCLTEAYHRFATARSRNAPRFIRWYKTIFEEDWVRYLDRAVTQAVPRGG